MKKFQKFTSRELTTNEANVVKGGVFCEVYIGHSSDKNNGTSHGQMKKAMELDEIAATDGMGAALAEGGSQFLVKYS